MAIPFRPFDIHAPILFGFDHTDEDYSRSASCALILISTFYFTFRMLEINNWKRSQF